jgi:hypothetical protein
MYVYTYTCIYMCMCVYVCVGGGAERVERSAYLPQRCLDRRGKRACSHPAGLLQTRRFLCALWLRVRFTHAYVCMHRCVAWARSRWRFPKSKNKKGEKKMGAHSRYKRGGDNSGQIRRSRCPSTLTTPYIHLLGFILFIFICKK